MFGKSKFPAVAALAGLTGAALTPELVSAANEELEANNITGAALISQAAHEELTAARTSMVGITAALVTAGAPDVATLAADRDSWKEKAEAFGSQAGALPTNATKEKPDVSEEGGDDNEKLVADLHAKMLGE
jgi:hypothetical protein